MDGNGVPTGEARRINAEVTDAPTWSGDSRQLLYLSNGQLRLVSREGGTPTAVPPDLPVARQAVEGKVVIHAGRLWNGLGSAVQTDVDVLVKNNRIARIKPHSNVRSPNRTYVDASDQTVIPGWWESHIHELIEGKYYGDKLGRLWMAYGVTSLQSVGDPVYRAAETRAAFAAGTRRGPGRHGLPVRQRGHRLAPEHPRPGEIRFGPVGSVAVRHHAHRAAVRGRQGPRDH